MRAQSCTDVAHPITQLYAKRKSKRLCVQIHQSLLWVVTKSNLDNEDLVRCKLGSLCEHIAMRLFSSHLNHIHLEGLPRAPCLLSSAMEYQPSSKENADESTDRGHPKQHHVFYDLKQSKLQVTQKRHPKGSSNVNR